MLLNISINKLRQDLSIALLQSAIEPKWSVIHTGTPTKSNQVNSIQIFKIYNNASKQDKLIPRYRDINRVVIRYAIKIVHSVRNRSHY